MGRVEEVDPPAGSGSLRSPIGGRAATLHLGAAERQGTLSSSSLSSLTIFVCCCGVYTTQELHLSGEMCAAKY